MEGRAQTRASVLKMEERRKKRTAAAFLCCRLITVGSWLEPTVIEPNHCWLLAWTGSDMWPSSHCRLETQTGSDSCHHCRFGHIPNQFWFSEPKTDSERSTLLVLLIPTVMRPAVKCYSVAVDTPLCIGGCRQKNVWQDIWFWSLIDFRLHAGVRGYYQEQNHWSIATNSIQKS